MIKLRALYRTIKSDREYKKFSKVSWVAELGLTPPAYPSIRIQYHNWVTSLTEAKERLRRYEEEQDE